MSVCPAPEQRGAAGSRAGAGLGSPPALQPVLQARHGLTCLVPRQKLPVLLRCICCPGGLDVFQSCWAWQAWMWGSFLFLAQCKQCTNRHLLHL